MFANTNEVKKYSQTARKRRGVGPYGVKPGLSKEDDTVQDKGKDDFTYTYGQYDNLLKHQEYCLTMQDKYIKEEELDEENQETDVESKSQDSEKESLKKPPQFKRRLSIGGVSAQNLKDEARLKNKKEEDEYASRTQERW